VEPGSSVPRGGVSAGERIGFRKFSLLPAGCPFERLDRARLVDVDHGVELVRHACREVVALPLGFRPVDHTDRPLQAWLAERFGGPWRGGEREEELLLTHLVAQLLDAVG
jgi:hypothetical protein